MLQEYQFLHSIALQLKQICFKNQGIINIGVFIITQASMSIPNFF